MLEPLEWEWFLGRLCRKLVWCRSPLAMCLTAEIGRGLCPKSCLPCLHQEFQPSLELTSTSAGSHTLDDTFARFIRTNIESVSYDVCKSLNAAHAPTFHRDDRRPVLRPDRRLSFPFCESLLRVHHIALMNTSSRSEHAQQRNESGMCVFHGSSVRIRRGISSGPGPAANQLPPDVILAFIDMTSARAVRVCKMLCGAIVDIALTSKDQPEAREVGLSLLRSRGAANHSRRLVSRVRGQKRKQEHAQSSHIDNPNGYLKPWHSTPIPPPSSLVDGRRALLPAHYPALHATFPLISTATSGCKYTLAAERSSQPCRTRYLQAPESE